MEMTRIQLAKKIASELECTTKVWAKDSHVRVYLSHRGKSYGYVAINSDGIGWALTGYANNTYGSVISKVAEGVVISEPKEVVPGVRRLTQSEADALASAPRKKNYRGRSTTEALDAMYGRGNWDQWDRKDYEG